MGLGIVDVDESIVDPCHVCPELHVTERLVVRLVLPDGGVERGRGEEDLGGKGPVEANDGDGVGLEVTIGGIVGVSAVVGDGNRGVDLLVPR